MAGQPTLLGWLVFDVTDLTVSDNTIQQGDSFDINATFTGDGAIWALLEMISDIVGPGIVTATAQFSAEGMGANAPEYDLGNVPVNLTAGGSPYTATLTVDTSAAPTDMQEGVYRIQCLVQLLSSAIMGFYDGDLLASVFAP